MNCITTTAKIHFTLSRCHIEQSIMEQYYLLFFSLYLLHFSTINTAFYNSWLVYLQRWELKWIEVFRGTKLSFLKPICELRESWFFVLIRCSSRRTDEERCMSLPLDLLALTKLEHSRIQSRNNESSKERKAEEVFRANARHSSIHFNAIHINYNPFIVFLFHICWPRKSTQEWVRLETKPGFFNKWPRLRHLYN